jgi:hypothetical protein
MSPRVSRVPLVALVAEHALSTTSHSFSVGDRIVWFAGSVWRDITMWLDPQAGRGQCLTCDVMCLGGESASTFNATNKMRSICDH